MKLAVFDYDSTLMDGETLEFLAREIGIERQVKEITDRAMRGELDFFESLQKRVSLLKGLEVGRVNDICANLPVMKGAEQTVKSLKDRGYKVVCFSGGFKNATIPFAQKIGLDAEFSNILHSKNGVLTGFTGGEMMFSESKGMMLQTLQKLLNVSYDNTIVAGDGANDLSMFKYASKRVSFCGKPALEKEANIIIKEKDLTQILTYI
ncbi:MAG: phosphoserine phosphatase SerB [Candidatus Gastranaerophilales bacterium]|nr:phosphoserine phosphatase SerB [Candidatus Gastranaerophilales bacterium]